MANLYCKSQKANSKDFEDNWERTFRGKSTQGEIKTIEEELPEYADAVKRRIDYAEAVGAKIAENSGRW